MARRYGEAYWTKEQPIEVKTKRVWLSYFPQAGKLQLATYFKKDGEDIRAKVVTLDQEDIALHPEARDLILRALEDWR
uniref:Uncharacterized protein n=1 Tax=Ammonifex degensii TaxID=42838 RepID=A0A7C2E2V0_9THEO